MRIVNFGQMIDVQTRQMAHQIVVETVDGRQHVITTDEATVSQLIAVMTNNVQAAQVQSMPTRAEQVANEVAARLQADADYGNYPETEESEFEDGAEIFGGEDDPGEVSEPVMGVIAEDRIAEMPEAVGGLGQPRPQNRAQLEVTQPPQPRRILTDKDGFALPVRAKTVPKDEMGYPIVRRAAAAPRIPDDNGEEDGAQI
jgi:hypothetical protein